VGDTGNDSLYGGEDNDILRGESGDDFLDGGNGRDSLFGGSGDDTMRGGAGADSFDGGTGQDLADYSGSTVGVNASLQTGTGVGGDAEGDRYSGTDGFIGSGQNDTLTGFDGFQRPGQNITDVFTNLIRGEGGDDIISGLGGPDSLFGGTGNDTIYGGSSIPGTENSSAADSNDLIGGGEGNDLLFGDLGNDTITGDAGSDRIFGGNNNDSLSGGADNDTLGGDAGNDRLAGGTGDDSLSGGAGSDSLRGDEGDDTLTGGSGTDSMFGGDGNDLFVYEINDILGGITETVDGGGVPFPPTGAPDPNDFDILDLREYGETYGWGQVRVAYTGNDPRSESGTVSLFDQNGLLIGFINFVEIEKVICFTPGTMILTDRGERPVEDLLADDLVMTRDNGLQPLRWVGRRHLSRLQLIADPDLQPVRIARDALRGDGPVRSMMVSPQHRVLVTGARAELLFGADEVLVPAKHLVGQLDATQVLPAKGVTYIHILFDRHEIVQSDGIWTESFQPAARSLNLMEAAVRQEILKIFPELATDTGAYTAARPSLKAHEARVLFAR
jgi:hypothetical protein